MQLKAIPLFFTCYLFFVGSLFTASAQNTKGTTFSGAIEKDPTVCAESANFLNEEEVENLITEMLNKIGVQNRYIIMNCAQVSNCQATIYKGKPYILYNPLFLGQVKKLQFSTASINPTLKVSTKDWEALTILAHELGHHINNHLLNPLPDATQRSMELEADETAGFIIYLMKGSVAQAQSAFLSISEKGSYTHPPRDLRLLAVEKGWNKAKTLYPPSGNNDADGDGIGDNIDKCPTQFGTLANGGCPDVVRIVSTEATKLLSEGVALFESKSYTKAMERFSMDLLKSNPTAQYYMGRMYFDGLGVPQRIIEGLALFVKSADQGNADGINALGTIYQNGDGVTKDYEEAIKWYKKAAAMGNIKGEYNLGNMIQNGYGAKQDYVEANRLFKKTAEKGFAFSLYKLGQVYLNGLGERKDTVAALKWFRKAAEQENPSAEYDLGVMYMMGSGIPQDYKEAYSWLKKAVQHDNVDAVIALAWLYYYGNGVAQNYTESFKWYLQAAQK